MNRGGKRRNNIINIIIHTSSGQHSINLAQGDEVLFSLDKFFKKSRIENVRKFEVSCDESKEATSCRIAKAIVNTLTLGLHLS